MADAIFAFNYKTSDGINEIDAYDASIALYGIARSTSILTHYVINRNVIKQAPYLSGAKVMISPPAKGSFEFIVPVIQAIADPANLAAVGQGLESTVLYDLTKVLFRRLSGRSEQPSSDRVTAIVRDHSGDVDALADSIEEDVVRVHRPIINNQGHTYNLSVSGGTVNIVNLNRETYDYAKAKIVGDAVQEFFGHVRSFNGSTNQGRFG